MKIQFVLLFQIFGTLLIAQTSNAEYKYIVEGYHQQKKHGLSPKEGYSFKKLRDKVTVAYTDTHTMEIKGLYKSEGTNTRLVAIMLEYYKVNANNVKNSEKYFCIPHPNSSKNLFNKAAQDALKIKDIKILKTYSFALFSFTSEFYFK